MWKHLIVVEEREDFRWGCAAADVVTLDAYLVESRAVRRRRIVNLCREHRHLGSGYYVSLVAAARGEEALPDMHVLADMEHAALRERLQHELESAVATGPRPPRTPSTFSLYVYFGQTEHPSFRGLARRAFERLGVPFLRIDLESDEAWRIAGLHILQPREVPKAHDAQVCAAIERLPFASGNAERVASRPPGDWMRLARPSSNVEHRTRFRLAVLVNADDKIPPSKSKALARLADVGRSLGIEVAFIEPQHFGHAHFDAMFIRETTAVSHHTYRFAREAEEQGIPVLDDAASIVRCTNKVFLAELMRRGGIAVPGTRLLTRRTLGDIAEEQAFPLVVKMPDGSFSKGVEQARDRVELRRICERMLARSHVVIVQDFLRTAFDWRIGVLDGKVLFAARYFMCDQHWQILKHGSDGGYVEGETQAVTTGDVPRAVIDTALRAARLVGDGLYGVDLKETSDGVFVMEVNDNPNIDVGLEDAVLGDELYRRLLLDFARRIEKARRGPMNVSTFRRLPGMIRRA